ncbi:MAG: SRPBCC family protein [Rhizobiaceae bacterium]
MTAFVPAPHPADENYATCQVEAVININADTFFSWYMLEPVENFMLGTMIVPAVTGTEPMAGPAWGDAGAMRTIRFKDGSHSLERILSTNWPRAYSYQPWAYTNPVRLLSDYAVATMSALPEGAATRIVWDYGFHARHSWALPALQAFVDYGWKRNLEGGLAVMKAHLEAHGADRRIHETARAA